MTLLTGVKHEKRIDLYVQHHPLLCNNADIIIFQLIIPEPNSNFNWKPNVRFNLTLFHITTINYKTWKLRGQIPPQSHLCGSNFQSTHPTQISPRTEECRMGMPAVDDTHLVVLIVCIVASGSAIPRLTSPQFLDV
jgi:hypothetical protein